MSDSIIKPSRSSTVICWRCCCSHTRRGDTATPATAQTLTVLHSFSGYPDGGNPEGGLILNSTGNTLYGTTWDGGLSNDFCSERGEFYGCGTLFKLTRHGSSWTFSLLYQFTGPDGAYQNQPVTIAPNNTIYGPSQEGGSCIFFNYGCGTIFNMAPSPTLPKSVLTPWVQTALYKFAGLGQGGPAPSAVVFGPDGKLYGTTSTGLYDYGDVFQLSRSGNSWTENILYDFTDQLDGSLPYRSGIRRSGQLFRRYLRRRQSQLQCELGLRHHLRNFAFRIRLEQNYAACFRPCYRWRLSRSAHSRCRRQSVRNCKWRRIRRPRQCVGTVTLQWGLDLQGALLVPRWHLSRNFDRSDDGCGRQSLRSQCV